MPDADATRLLRHASSLFQAGRYDAAIPVYRELLQSYPNLPNSWFNLAFCEQRMRHFDDALRSYDHALRLGIDRAEEVHLQRGVIFADDLGQSDGALRELTAALMLNPRYVPALLNLGNLHEDRGDQSAARTAYERALAIDPDDALVLARLSGVTDPGEAGDALLRRMRNTLNHPGMTLMDRADLGFALGAALVRRDLHEAAFAAYADANRASRSMAEQIGVHYDRRDHESLVERLIAAFPAPRVVAGIPADNAGPIFICGMFRSGSTLAERILARHSMVIAGGELDVLPALIRTSLQPYPEAIRSAPDQVLVALRRAYLEQADRRHPPGTVLTDKRPDNFLHIGLVKALFPAARIVHTVREPRDNILSAFFLHAGPELAYATDLGDTAHYLAQERRLMAHWRALYPGALIELDYDRLVEHPRSTIAGLLDALGLPWEDALLDHQHPGDAVRTASNWQVRQPLYRESSGRWRHYASHLEPVDAMY